MDTIDDVVDTATGTVGVVASFSNELVLGAIVAVALVVWIAYSLTKQGVRSIRSTRR